MGSESIAMTADRQSGLTQQPPSEQNGADAELLAEAYQTAKDNDSVIPTGWAELGCEADTQADTQDSRTGGNTLTESQYQQEHLATRGSTNSEQAETKCPERSTQQRQSRQKTLPTQYLPAASFPLSRTAMALASAAAWWASRG